LVICNKSELDFSRFSPTISVELKK